MKQLTPFFLVGLSIALALLFGEVALRLLLPLSPEDRKSLETLIRASAPADQKTPGREYLAHPFWGHQVKPSGKGVNNFGFLDPKDGPYKKQNQNEVVVGLFGGSVAQHVSRYLREELVQPIDSPKCHLSIQLLNFALEGFRQPSQFNIAHFFIDDLDLTVNLDGNNEITAGDTEGIPVNYPEFYSELYQPTKERLALMDRASRYQSLREFDGRLFGRWPFLLRSELASRTGFALDLYLEREKRLLFKKMETELPYPISSSVVNPEQVLEAAVGSWEKYVSLQYAVAENRGKRALFFIQPSQYGPDKKPMSLRERRVSIEESLESNLEKKFKALRESGRRLKKQNIPVFDFISLFSGTEEEIFADTCCHLNARGNKKLAIEIARIIREEIEKTYCFRRMKDSRRRTSSSLKKSQ